MRTVVRTLVVCCLLVAPFGSNAFAAPLLTGATLTYTDPIGTLGPHSTLVLAGVEFCGTNVAPSCSGTDLSGNFGVLLQDDTIDFGSTTIVFDLEGGGADHPSDSNYFDLNLDPTATFSITGMTFDLPNAYLANVSVQLTDVIGVAVGNEVTFGGNSINFLVGTLGVSKQPGRGQIAMTLDIRQRTQPPNIPEPSSLMLLGAGLVATAGALRRRVSR